MGNLHQTRRDIDKLYYDLYNQIDGSLNLVGYRDGSTLRNVHSKIDTEGKPTDKGTIDALFDYYHLTELYDRIIELEARVKELEDG